MFFKKKNLIIISKTYKFLQNKYKKKRNIQLYLKKNKFTHGEIIKLAYDTQSGSYINFFKNLNEKQKDKVYYPFVEAINKEFKNIKNILDFGCGELTTSLYIFNNLRNKIKKYFANDLSFNRLLLGSNELKKKLSKNNFNKFEIFCNSDYNLPFKDNAIDLVITIHSLEPNNQIKIKIINELFRVSKFGIAMMEPHYEIGSITQKNRMKKFGYIKGIKNILKRKRVNFKIIKKDFHLNNNNKSSIFIIKKIKKIKKNQQIRYVDPITKTKLTKNENILFSKNSLRAFPIVNNISLFNHDSQIFLPNINFKLGKTFT